MSLIDFIHRYNDDVLGARDAAAAARYIADPCLRHEPGQVVTMSLADNVARIESFFGQFPGALFEGRLLVADDEHVVSCWQAETDDGGVLSGIEVFRVVDDKIVETWNSKVAPDRWG